MYSRNYNRQTSLSEKMKTFCNLTTCRGKHVLNYFGENSGNGPNCAKCDNCLAAKDKMEKGMIQSIIKRCRWSIQSQFIVLKISK